MERLLRRVMELPRDGKAVRASDQRVRGKLFTYLRSSPRWCPRGQRRAGGESGQGQQMALPLVLSTPTQTANITVSWKLPSMNSSPT